MFTRLTDDRVTWADGTTERLDAPILATGYRPHLPYLAGLDGALDPAGRPHHRDGTSPAHPGLEFVGLEWHAARPRTPCAASAATPPGRPAVWPPGRPAPDPPPS
ncbi:hypothetical protein ACF09Z_22535 [Streptomyces erythrochromogenes]|uniref:hypothetical protein n=1 Tax=Streptomyces erythrochromogenes TaxID=285574 RepID=UPI0036FB3141